MLKWAGAAGGLALLFLLAEIWARGKERPRPNTLADLKTYTFEEGVFTWYLKPDSDVIHEGIHYRINHFGLRGPEPAREKSSFRIVFLGPSITFGQGVEFEKTIPERVKALFLEKGKKVEVINAGIGGHTSVQGLARMRKHVLPFSPDLLVVSFGLNDGTLDTMNDKKRGEAFRAGGMKQPSPSLSNSGGSALYRRIMYSRFALRLLTPERRAGMKRLFGKEGSFTPPLLEPRVSEEEFRQAMTGIVKAAREALPAIPVLLVAENPVNRNFSKERGATVYKRQREIHARYATVMGELSRDLGCLFVDVHLAFEKAWKEGRRGLIQKDGIHPRAEGLEIYGREIMRGLENVVHI